MQPTIGTIVHFHTKEVGEDGQEVSYLRPAMVVAVHTGECATLMVFCDDEPGIFLVKDAAQGFLPGCWEWPLKEVK